MATKINPYLNFNGNCEEAFNFYKKAFGGDFTMVVRPDETPMEVAEDGVDKEAGWQKMHKNLFRIQKTNCGG